ncbi:hypothetical protein DXG01_016043, partial [Tephrocybe rancida]
KARESAIVDDGFNGAVISIGSATDAVLDRFHLLAKEIPKLRLLMQTERSSKWAEAMRGSEFAYSYEIASLMSEALKADVGATLVCGSAPAKV